MVVVEWNGDWDCGRRVRMLEKGRVCWVAILVVVDGGGVCCCFEGVGLGIY